jgi:hypothetical protein
MVNGVQGAYGSRYAAETRPSGGTAAAEVLRDTVDTGSVRALVEKLLAGQSGQSMAAGAWGVDPETAEAARQAISEDGEWGVKAVSDRIVGFAIALSGNDSSKLAQLKAAIDKGFAEAEKAFGGQLPDICMQTRDAIMQKLDAWAAE